jgi:hypothetical protein
MRPGPGTRPEPGDSSLSAAATCYCDGGVEELSIFWSLFAFFAFLAFVFLAFAGFAVLVESVDCALLSCANIGAASEIASAAVKSSVSNFFIGVATSLGLNFALLLARQLPDGPQARKFYVTYYKL